MFRYYLWAIGICSALIFTLTAIFVAPVYGISVWFCLLATVISVILAFVIDAIVAILVRKCPQKCFDPYKKFFRPLKWEKGFYQKIGIRKWKDKIPETGKLLVKFGKSKVEDTSDPKYIYRFLTELGYAEVMHLISAFAGFLVIFALPLKYMLFFGIPVASINFILQILPFFIQRFNRPRLLIVYERALKKAEKEEKETAEN